MKRLLTPNHHPVNKDGLVLWLAYRNTGSVAALGSWKDYSGAGDNGALVGDAFVDGLGVNCDGTGDRVDINLGQTYTVRTIIMNFKINSIPVTNIFLSDGATYQGFTRQSSGGCYYLNSAGSNIANIGTINLNTRYFIAFSSTGSEMSFYVDGTIVGSPVSASTTQSSTISLGAKQGGGYEADISIDDVMIFNRVLSAGEIKQNYLKNRRN